MGYADVFGVIGDRDIFIAHRPCGLGHFLQRGLAIALLGVDMQVALHVLDPHELGKPSFFRRFDLTLVLAQFRLDIWKIELCVDIGFAASRDPLCTAKHAVLVELQLALQAHRPDSDVVRLGPGEIDERRTVASFRYDPHVDLHAGFELDGRLCAALRQNVFDLGISYETRSDVGTRAACHQNIQVADGFLPAAVAAGDFGPDHTRHRLQIVQIGFADFLRVGELEARGYRRLLRRLEDVCESLGSEASDFPQAAAARRRIQILARLDVQGAIERADALGADARNLRHIRKRRRQFVLERFQFLEFLRFHDLGKLVRKIVADTRKLREVRAFAQHRRNIPRKILDGSCRVAICADAERVRALDLQKHRIAVEKAGDLRIVDRHYGAAFGSAGTDGKSRLLRTGTFLKRDAQTPNAPCRRIAVWPPCGRYRQGSGCRPSASLRR